MKQFSHVISLGYNCGPAYQIRLHTRIAESHFFDWLYTSAQAATFLIRTGFDGFMERQNLIPTREDTEVLDRGSGIRFNHSFKTAPGAKTVSASAIDADYANECSKFQHLQDKFLAALSSPEPILFIRYNPYPEKPDKEEEIAALADAIASRVANPDFELYWLLNNQTEAPTPPRANVKVIDLHENRARSTSFSGRDFIGTDDLAWAQTLSTVVVSKQGKRLLAGGEPVLIFR